ncbi:D-alanyl-D-alanine dipeptidase-like [Bradysia coprophila]|uniref:D-alanyl-D-alanine dipeptidase-like n=1 Tax=Bradysia coprophila TaxID=38358 RepID=UPI00187DC8C4|nr:D-alanyl-D-alanine dipeptidase-like [Bradysia coprophila]
MISLLLLLLLSSYSYGLPDGFIYTGELNLTYPILTSLRYGTRDNFVGGVVRGYENVPLQGAVVTAEAGQALAKAQLEFLKDGFRIVIYDSYRPTKAVDHFVEWAENDDVDEDVKRIFYPNVEKSNLFDLGYIASRSGHSRGSTIDLTLIRINNSLTSVHVLEKTLNGNYSVYYLEDGTLDMGSSFDIFDEVSHYDNPYIFDEHKSNREYLKTVMESAGFVAYDQEWWHFRLRDEPHPLMYFDFDMHEPSNVGISLRVQNIALLVTSLFVCLQTAIF